MQINNPGNLVKAKAPTTFNIQSRRNFSNKRKSGGTAGFCNRKIADSQKHWVSKYKSASNYNNNSVLFLCPYMSWHLKNVNYLQEGNYAAASCFWVCWRADCWIFDRLMRASHWILINKNAIVPITNRCVNITLRFKSWKKSDTEPYTFSEEAAK